MEGSAVRRGAEAAEASGDDDRASSASGFRTSRGSAFRAYARAAAAGVATGGSLGDAVRRRRRPLVARLTNEIISTYQICNPEFRALTRRYLTDPSVAAHNEGHDNANSDLILYVNYELVNISKNRRYIVKEMLGQGTFGQVVKCWDTLTSNFVAVKVIKNQPAYYQQALVEVSILRTLNDNHDPGDQHYIVRMLDFFSFQNHLCIAFELLGSNLYELLKKNNLKGLSLNYVQKFSKQILNALVVLKDAGIIHCDLKPENILIYPRVKTGAIKVIDFGSACLETKTVYSYIQSRYYRSPEVVLGYPYTTAIDMWSFGCIVAELFLGLPLFPGASEYDLLSRMVEILGRQPPDDFLRGAKNTLKFFRPVGSIPSDFELSSGVGSAYKLLTEEEYGCKELKRPIMGKWYNPRYKLEELIEKYPYRKNLPEAEGFTERSLRMQLVDFLRGLVEFDPNKRWSPLQASFHPFVTGQPFEGPYRPIPESPRIPVGRAATVDHHPGGGHWVAAGLSPQVGNVNRNLQYHGAVSQLNFSYGSSYGSLGSHGSYTDNAGASSSYGSYGDANMASMYYSSFSRAGHNIQAQVAGPFLGTSPDVRQRPPISRGNGIGFSPGGMGPTSLGASPSQFTPPSSQLHMASTSPGNYGPSSPVRSSYGSSSLSRAAAVAQYNRRRNLGHPPLSMPVQEYLPTQHGHHEGIGSSHPEAYVQGHTGYVHSGLSNSGPYNWRPQMAHASGLSSDGSSGHGFMPMAHIHQSEALPGWFELGPDPSDWNPHYSVESLLEDDNSEVASLSTEFNNRFQIGSRVSRSGHSHNQGAIGSNPLPINHRTNRIFQPSSLGEHNHFSPHDTHAGFIRGNLYQHNSSRVHGQHFMQRPSHMNSYMPNERPQPREQQADPNYSNVELYSSADITTGDDTPWAKPAAKPGL